jgi:putative transposase
MYRFAAPVGNGLDRSAGGFMELPDRKHTRLPGFDYSSQNYYFVTICTHNKVRLFGETSSDGIKPSRFGEIARTELLEIPGHFEGIQIDRFAVMPDHVHAIILIGCDGAERSRPFPTLSGVVGLYKSGVSKRIHEIEPDIPVWQKSFYDRIIRDEQAYREVLQYIDENPLKRALLAEGSGL